MTEKDILLLESKSNNSDIEAGANLARNVWSQAIVDAKRLRQGPAPLVSSAEPIPQVLQPVKESPASNKSIFSGVYRKEDENLILEYPALPFLARPATLGGGIGLLFLNRMPTLGLGVVAAGAGVNGVHDAYKFYHADSSIGRFKYGIATAADIGFGTPVILAALGKTGKVGACIMAGSFFMRLLVEKLPDRVIEK